MKLYAGIDLRSNNNYLGISDEQSQKIFRNKLPNDLYKIVGHTFTKWLGRYLSPNIYLSYRLH